MNRGLDFDLGLMLVTDRVLSGSRPVIEVVEEAAKGGVTVVQLREKDAPVREFVELGRRVREVLRPYRVPLLINDRVDVALAVVADGVHLGQTDMSVSDARRLLGPKAIIGLTVETMAQADAADRMEADYLGVSPIFPTPTKTDTGPAWGIEGLWRLRPVVRKRLVAIGGINETNGGRVLETGADGIAVVSAICAAVDPEAAARRLREIVDRHRRPKAGVRP
jgi:thiamine-phosphate pyrophosphorylase